MGDVQKEIHGLGSAARETLRCLFFHGPTQDGELPSKTGRDQLVDRGHAFRHNGWNCLSAAGMVWAMENMVMHEAKEAWQNARRRKA